jgi:hypothetical protein
MNATEIQEVFQNIESSADNRIIASPIIFKGLNHLTLLFKDESGLAHVIIEAREGFVELDELKGIACTNVTYTLEDIKITRFYEYFCKHEKYLNIYFPFIADILSKLVQVQNIVKAHKSVITLWKHCFEDPESSILSIEKEIGLIGELLFLNKLLTSNDNATKFWNGPLGGVDFVINRNRVEIKTTLTNSHSHTINGIEQLEDKEGTNLFLCSLLLQATDYEDNNSFTLESVYLNTIAFLENNPVHLDLFYKKIKQLNLTPEIIKVNNFRKYFEYDFKIYPVTQEFPKIIKSSFKIAPVSRISKVRYDVELEGLEEITILDLIKLSQI